MRGWWVGCSHKYGMRIAEVLRTIQPQAPLSPARARVAALQRNVSTARQAVSAERERQRAQTAAQQRQAAAANTTQR